MVGLYWEDWEIGKEYVSPSRTITEADIVHFAGISGDYNPCLLYTSPSPRDRTRSRMPSSA